MQYFESRGGKFEDICFFGLQYFVKRYLCGPVVTEDKILAVGSTSEVDVLTDENTTRIDAGGRFFREENLHELAESISVKKVTVDSRREVELWATPLYFILIMLVVTIEWVVRKFSHLK